MFSMDANELQMHLFMMDRNGKKVFKSDICSPVHFPVAEHRVLLCT